MRNLIILLCLTHAGTASAHHAYAADYEVGNEGVIEGTITEVIYKNPHARYYLEVESDDGGTETWDLQTMNLRLLGRVGWRKDTLQVGDHVRVEGTLGRNNTKRLSIGAVTFDDGRVLTPLRGFTETNAELSTRSVAETPATAREFESIAANISPGSYELDENHAYLSFSYSHLGLSNPQLQFADFQAMLDLDGNDMANSKVNLTIDAASIVSASAELDDILRGADFLDTANHPEIVFTSTSYQETSANTGTLTGDLTIAGVSRPVTLDVYINLAEMSTMNRRELIGFSASGTMNRSDFGMSSYEAFVEDELALNLQVEFQKIR
jgi:polyisoprenoid-binding protein YceI